MQDINSGAHPDRGGTCGLTKIQSNGVTIAWIMLT